jgi:hypothetical protein
MRSRAWASATLATGGLLLIALGLYFAFLRPPLLPEDSRYMGTSFSEIQAAVPGLLTWLPHVFRVLGGYMFATGLLTSYLAATAFREGRAWAVPIAAAAGLASLGVMVATNFLIGSDFKWLLAAMFLPWPTALLLWGLGSGQN